MTFLEHSGGKTSIKAVLRNLGREIWKHKAIYALLIPGLVWYFIFCYIPMGGLSLAFKQYKANLGIWASPWVGFENYKHVFRDTAFWASIRRTLIINAGRLVFCFPFPVLLSLMINELRVGKYKKIMQTIFTFPHFLSWVIVASIITNVLSYDGLVNSVLNVLGIETVKFLGNQKFFQPLLYITEIWKASGWSAIVYMAAISGIDVEQYEAAEIDGATRMQRIIHITLPSIMPTIVVMFILATGNIMTAGFDQVFNLSNAAVKSVSETLDMYIYRVTFQSATDFSFSMAVSLFKSVINMVLLFLADRGAKLMGGSGLFG